MKRLCLMLLFLLFLLSACQGVELHAKGASQVSVRAGYNLR